MSLGRQLVAVDGDVLLERSFGEEVDRDRVFELETAKFLDLPRDRLHSLVPPRLRRGGCVRRGHRNCREHYEYTDDAEGPAGQGQGGYSRSTRE